MRFLTCTLAVSALLTITAAAAPAADPPDLILTGGRIATLDEQNSFVEAIAIRDGLIRATGTTAAIRRMAGPETREIKLAGRTVIPGLIETHCHAIGVGLSAMNVPYRDLRSIGEIQAWVQERAQEVPAGRWIQVPRADITRLAEMRFPTRDELDGASATHPVSLTSARKEALNGAAWKALGVEKNSDELSGAKIVRDDKGRPWLLSGGSQYIRKHVPRPEYSKEEKLRALKRVHDAYVSVGITSIFERALNADGWRLYQALKHRGDLQLRVTATIRQQFSSGKQVEDFTTKLCLTTGSGDDWLRVGPLKITVDGGIHWGTAHLREPFGPRRINFYKNETLVDPDYNGQLRYSVDQMRDVFLAGHKLGWQMCCHVAGDAAVDRILDALEAVNEELPLKDRRFTLTHAYFPVKDAIERCRRLGVCVDTQSYVYYRDARFINRIYGPNWSSRFIGVGEWYRGGVPVTINSDHMIGLDPDHSMNSFSPFLQLFIAVTRRDAYGNVYGEHQKLSRTEALRCVTTNAAWLGFDEGRKGTLEPGRFADLVVLDRDYFTCPENDIAAIRPTLTIVAGPITFESPKRSSSEGNR